CSDSRSSADGVSILHGGWSFLITARANDDIANGDSPLHNNLPPDLDTGRVSDSQSVASQPLHINLRPTDRVSGDRGTHRSSGNEEHVTGLVSELIARQENGDVGSVLCRSSAVADEDNGLGVSNG